MFRHRRIAIGAAAIVALACATIAPVASAQSSGAVKINPAMSGMMQSVLRIRNAQAGRAVASIAAPTSPASLVNNPATDLTSQDTQSETTVVFSGGTQAVAAFNDSGAFSGASPHFTGYSYSANNGKTWTDKGTLPTDAIGDAGDPSLAFDSLRSKVYLVTLGLNNSSVLRLFTSTDGGQTFGAAINPAPGNTASAFLDKEWLTVDNTAGAGQGNAYLAYRDFGSSGGMKFNRSVDGGVTWSNAINLLPNDGQGAWVTVGPDHAVYYFFLAGAANQIKVRKSVDQGVTFAPAVLVVDLLTTGVNGDLTLGGGFRGNAFPQAVVGLDGVIYVVYNDNPAGVDKGDVFLKTSTDGGTTWSAATKVNDDLATADNWQPSVALNTAGTRIAVGYYDRSADPANLLIQRRIRTGTVGVGGAITFNASKSLSPSFPAVIGQDPVINTTYMGDYDQIAGTGVGFLTVWGDNRDSDTAHAHQPDVRRALVKA